MKAGATTCTGTASWRAEQTPAGVADHSSRASLPIHPPGVMAGLDPATHVPPFSPAGVDTRVKPGHDEASYGTPTRLSLLGQRPGDPGGRLQRMPSVHPRHCALSTHSASWPDLIPATHVPPFSPAGVDTPVKPGHDEACYGTPTRLSLLGQRPGDPSGRLRRMPSVHPRRCALSTHSASWPDLIRPSTPHHFRRLARMHESSPGVTVHLTGGPRPGARTSACPEHPVRPVESSHSPIP